MTDRMSRNLGTELPTYSARNSTRTQVSFTSRQKPEVTHRVVSLWVPPLLPPGKGFQCSLNRNLGRPLSRCLHDVIMCMSRNSIVGIAAFYFLDGAEFELRWGGDFPHPSGPALGPT